MIKIYCKYIPENKYKITNYWYLLHYIFYEIYALPALILIIFMTSVCSSRMPSGALASYITNNWNLPKNPIQIIYDSLCNAGEKIMSVCDQSINPDFSECMDAMNMLTLEDIGLRESALRSLRSSVCMTICSNTFFDMAIFLIPAGGKIPLHDHPNMTVISKLLCGRMHTRSFTSKERKDGCVLVLPPTVTTHNVEDRPWLLTPVTDNIHEFIAESPCAIFDALLPPYGDPDRPCTYYGASQGSDGSWRLHPVPPPSTGLPVCVPYRGYKPNEKL